MRHWLINVWLGVGYGATFALGFWFRGKLDSAAATIAERRRDADK